MIAPPWATRLVPGPWVARQVKRVATRSRSAMASSSVTVASGYVSAVTAWEGARASTAALPPWKPWRVAPGCDHATESLGGTSFRAATAPGRVGGVAGGLGGVRG